MPASRAGHWTALACIVMLLAAAARAEDDLQQLEEAAIRAAVDRVAPSVVRIETVGGLERVGSVLLGTGPTTGLVVSDDGYIISSAFNFAARPSSILVTLDDGTRLGAQMVATDHSRMLTLLKIDPPRPLTVAEAAPRDDVRVGRWALALGRTFDGAGPNVAVGVVSALDRIWGKVVQTDANVSPANYGGPLVDIHGRVLGVLVPMSPSGGSEVAGIEWYDSGIGFAVPLEHVFEVLPRLARGEDLHPGLLGVSFRRGNPLVAPPVLGAVRAGSPAGRAGLKPEDLIVSVDGVEVRRQPEFESELKRRYAGEVVQLAWRRGDEAFESSAELVAKLEPYDYPFLGILPLRETGDDVSGVAVRYVYPGSGAEKGGIQAGDRIVAAEGQQVATREALVERLTALDVGQSVRLLVRRGDDELELDAELGRLPVDVPPSLPAAEVGEPAEAAEMPEVGTMTIQLPELPNTAHVHVPADYHPAVPHGVVLWLQSPGEDDEAILKDWEARCAASGLILVAPRPSDTQAWQPADVAFITKLLDKIGATYNIDASRVIAHGYRAGGSLAYLLASADRDRIRAVAAVGGAPPRVAAYENEPLRPLAFLIAVADGSSEAEAVGALVQRLEAARLPVTRTSTGDETRYLNDDELAELERWIDTLDRI